MSKKDNLGLIVTIAIAAILISLSLVFVAISLNAPAVETSAAQNNELQNGQLVETSMQDLVGENYFLGNPEAPITLIEYSDYTCGWCRKFSNDVLPQLKKDYIETGLVKFVYIPFPSGRANSQTTAKASYCAGNLQGASGFFKMHDGIFSTSDMSPNGIATLTKAQGLDNDAFQACMDDKNTDAFLQAELKKAIELGVRGTPNLIINGLAITGFVDYETLNGMLTNLQDAQ